MRRLLLPAFVACLFLTSAQAALAANGSIAGHVTDGTTPIQGICVEAFASFGPPSGTANTDASGDFNISLAPGNYALKISTNCGTNGGDWATELYDNKTNPNQADLVPVTDSQVTTLANTIVLEHGGAISGAVTGGGGGVAGICVDAWSATGSGPGGPGAIADGSSVSSGAGGDYLIKGLRPGDYKVFFQTGCGASPSWISEWHNNGTTFAGSDPVTVTAGNTATSSADLQQGVIFSGTLTGAGGPTTNLCAGVLNSTTGAFVGTSSANPIDGTWQIIVPVGSYKVGFADCSGSAHTTEYYNDTTDFSAAQLFQPPQVAAGATISGLNAQLADAPAGTGSVAVHVTKNSGVDNVAGVCLALINSLNVSTFGLTDANGNYTFSSLSAGNYTVRVNGGCGANNLAAGLADRWYSAGGGSSTPEGAGQIAVATSLVNVSVDLPAEATISGTVTDPGSQPLQGICVAAQSNASGFVESAVSGADGTYTISHLGANPSWKIIFLSSAPCPSGVADNYVTQWFNGQSSFAAGDNVATTAGNNTPNVDAQMAYKPLAPTCPANTSANATHTGASAADVTCTDLNGDALTYSVVSQPTHGTVTDTPNSDGGFTYTADGAYTGADSFTYKANDGTHDSNTATVNVTVAAPVNHEPSCSDLGPLTVNAGGSVPVALDCTDEDGDTLTYSILGSPAHGDVTGTGAARTYTPTSSSFSSDSFTYQANDGSLNSTAATVSITINRLPTCGNQNITIVPNEAKDVTLACSDADGDPVGYSIVVAPAHGVLTGSGTDRHYTPDTDYHGEDFFSYRGADGHGDGPVGVINFKIDNAPVCPDVSTNVDQGGHVELNLACTDANGDALTYTMVPQTLPQGTASIDPDGVFTYDANADATGQEVIYYTANDGLLSSTAGPGQGGQITVHINDVTAPETTIVSGPSGTVTSTAASFDYTSNEDGSAFTCTLDGNPLPCDFSGVDQTGLGAGSHTFTVYATDGASNDDLTPASRTWTIDPASTVQGSSSGTAPPNGTVSTGATPQNGDLLTTGVTTPTGGPVSISENGSITTPPPTGYDVFGQEVVITAPDATVGQPLHILFYIDSTLLTGIDPATVAVVRNGTPIPVTATCTNGGLTANPDPCYQSRGLDSHGDYHIMILSSHASTWNFAKPKPADTGGGGGGGDGGGGTPPVETPPATTPPATTPPVTTPPPVSTPAVKKCKVPKLKGKTLAQAKKLLKKANCGLGKTTKKNGKGKKGTVLSSKPAAGKVLKAGTKVALVLRK